MSDRDRDELAALIDQYTPAFDNTHADSVACADAILAAGWRRSTVTPEQGEVDHDALARTLTKMLDSARSEQWSDNRCMLAADRLAVRVSNGEFGLSVAEDGEQ